MNLHKLSLHTGIFYASQRYTSWHTTLSNPVTLCTFSIAIVDEGRKQIEPKKHFKKIQKKHKAKGKRKENDGKIKEDDVVNGSKMKLIPIAFHLSSKPKGGRKF